MRGVLHVPGDGKGMKILGRGDVILKFNSGLYIRVSDVAYVPNYIANIFKPKNTSDFHFIEKFDKIYIIYPHEDYREELIALKTNSSNSIYELDLINHQVSLISAQHDKRRDIIN